MKKQEQGTLTREKKDRILELLDELSHTASPFESAKIASQIRKITTEDESEEKTKELKETSTQKPIGETYFHVGKAHNLPYPKAVIEVRTKSGHVAKYPQTFLGTVVVLTESESDSKFAVGRIDLNEEALRVTISGEHFLISAEREGDAIYRQLADVIYPEGSFEGVSCKLEHDLLFVTVPRTKVFEIEDAGPVPESGKPESRRSTIRSYRFGVAKLIFALRNPRS
jgi:hypothetical protein